MKLPDPVAWRVECRWKDRTIDQTWRKYGDYGTRKAAESSQQVFANPGDIESRVVPLFPKHAILDLLSGIRAAIPANLASDKPYRPVNLGWSQCAETMRKHVDSLIESLRRSDAEGAER